MTIAGKTELIHNQNYNYIALYFVHSSILISRYLILLTKRVFYLIDTPRATCNEKIIKEINKIIFLLMTNFNKKHLNMHLASKFQII